MPPLNSEALNSEALNSERQRALDSAAPNGDASAMPKPEPAATLTVDGHEVRITHPDKPYFTRDVKLSKLDIVRYYLQIAPGAVAGIRDRPIVL